MARILTAVVAAALAAPLLAAPASAAPPSTYFLKPPGGNPAAPAGSQEITDLSHANLTAGSTVLLASGATYPDQLMVYGAAGTPEAPITITSTPGGKATIAPDGKAPDGKDEHGLVIMDSSNITVDNVSLAGTSALPESVGINIWSWSGDDMAGINVNNVDSNGFKTGLYAGTDANAGKIHGLRIADSTFAGARINNVATSAHGNGYGLTDVHLHKVVAHGSTGDPALTDQNSGSGIVLGGVDGGTIDESHAYDNGAHSNASEGPEGIWAYSSRNITIQNSLSENNKTQRTDGDGFGFDIDVYDSKMIGNTSRNNAGAGYLIFTYGDHETRNILLENNSSTNDSTLPYSFSPIAILGGLEGSSGTGHVSDVTVRNNTITLPAGDPRAAIQVGQRVRNITITGNTVSGGAGELDASSVHDPSQVHHDKPAPTPPPPPGPTPGSGSSSSGNNGGTFFSWLGGWFGRR